MSKKPSPSLLNKALELPAKRAACGWTCGVSEDVMSQIDDLVDAFLFGEIRDRFLNAIDLHKFICEQVDVDVNQRQFQSYVQTRKMEHGKKADTSGKSGNTSKR